MKNYLTIALIFVASISLAQQKHPNHLDSMMVKALSIRNMPEYHQTLELNPDKFGTGTIISNQINTLRGQGIIPPASIVISGKTGSDILIKLKKDGRDIGLSDNWGIVEFKMKKSQFRWLNDSTAVFIRK